MRLACSYEREADTASAMLAVYGEAIEIASPTVPGCDQHSYDRMSARRYQQSPRGFQNQAFQILRKVRSARVLTACLLPHIEDQRHILYPGGPDVYLLGSQAARIEC
jgi:hypothetical protein